MDKKIKGSKSNPADHADYYYPGVCITNCRFGVCVLIGAPVAQIFTSLTVWLAGMKGSSSILLALILGAMISFDMGGPVNKVAFLFGSAMIGEETMKLWDRLPSLFVYRRSASGLQRFWKKEIRGIAKRDGESGIHYGALRHH